MVAMGEWQRRRGAEARKWLLTTSLLFAACGGKAGSAAPESPGTAGAPSAEEPSPECAKTARSPEDEVTNAATLDMAAHAQPDKLMPVMLSLVAVDYPMGAMEAERTAQLDPYQTPIVKRLEELGAQDISRYWLVNAISASLVAEHVSEVPCWPNIVRVEVDANYWDIVEPPWSSEDAGSIECPLIDDECPEHCFDFVGIPFDERSGCYAGQERVGCAKTTAAVSDGAASCFEKISTGKTYLFHSFVPIEPNFIGWRACGAQTQISFCSSP